MVLGAFLIILGGFFLAGQFLSSLFRFDVGHHTWPFAIIIPGALLFLASFASERRTGIGLAVVGGIISMVGVILLVQNTFDVYASWSYAWALVFPISVGLAKLAYGSLRSLGDEVKSGLKLTLVGAVLFLVGGFFFELIIGVDGFYFGTARMLWPLILIIPGALLLLWNMLPRGDRS